ncbi:ABC-type nitrate/sulfonate/bicarbonate transport systems, periplasmic components [Rhodovastum atsumiense]|uniref:ABC transporter substrate-binding protein n=1 Tax=Rhodovastum atsumiense TaxID=504468 RepID=A0A5M6IUT5_9PROT|nr:ABC transporter substrate-binding protein [Rhodovastum atsumiense]KAA5611991.1 ABC transporter substrate-binding protein [Rhodovastum atsumiense]CAH2598771.1 ABC-type nitrate/sulfonate/bicarbonate transport systems, periplasmic components [Rhodovastum atsumiense]
MTRQGGEIPATIQSETQDAVRTSPVLRRGFIGGMAAGIGLLAGVAARPSASYAGSRGAAALPRDLLDSSICRVAAVTETPAPLAGPPRHLRFAYNGTGICTAAVPVALHRGYFAKQNLEVEFVQLAGSTDQMLQALATDKADVGASMLLNWLKPLEQGFDVKLTTGLHGGCTRLLVRRDSGFTGITDLKGKTIGVSSLAGSPRHFFAILLSRHGIDPDTGVNWREFPADLLPVALQRGEVQALADSDPAVWLTRLRSNGELVELASNLSENYATLSCCTLGVRAALYRDERATTAALTRAMQAAAHHVATQPDDAAEIFSKYTPKVPVTELAAMLRSHTHDHAPAGAVLRREVVQITSDLKRARIIKPSTDPVKLADRVVVDVLS